MTSNFPSATQHQQETRALRRATLLTGLTGIGLLAGVLTSIIVPESWWVWACYLVAYLAGGVPAGREALRELAKGRLDIDLLMVLAALAAAAVGEPRDGAILLFLFSLAGTLEDYALGRTKRAVESLLQLRPDRATRRIPGSSETEVVAVEALVPGDLVVIKPGERIAVDGVILHGSSAVDQATITGESIPVDKAAGDLVFAATVNGYGVLEVKVSKLAGESTLARMIALVTEAQSQRAPSQRFSDWFGQRYTVLVLLGSGAALAVFFLLGMSIDNALYRAATLLVAASPCAVVISVPAAILSALAAAARGGVLFKGGAALEDFGTSTVLALDKTGTLTRGKPAVSDIVPFDGDARDLLRLAAAIEAHSEHPIAQSIVAYAREQRLTPPSASQVVAVPGQGVQAMIDGLPHWAGNRKLLNSQGLQLSALQEQQLAAVEAQGKSPVIIGANGRLLGLIAVADTLRPGAASALAELRQSGFERIVMITGDHPEAAQHIGRQLGLAAEDIFADLLPEEKLAVVKGLEREAKVAYVGDGVNDAAALAHAHVGVAMGTAGSDVAIEAADVALLSDDLSRLVAARRLAQRANRIVRQNLTFAVSVMVVLVLFTLFGNLPLPLAVVGHEGGTLVVVFNGLRLLMTRRTKPRYSTPNRRPVPVTGND
ncbi:MAG: cadmium-translocating P-type ATPase [Truepera sp.]|nr:cadmium-translocating P-type ATPase [Truepera sp.]